MSLTKKILSAEHSSKGVVHKKSVKYPDMNTTKKSKNKKTDKASVQEAQKKINRCKEAHDQRLDLSKMDLATLPTSVKDLHQLSDFYAYKNKLSKVPDEIGCLINLSTLALYENHLTSLPISLQNLKLLKMLDLR